MKRNLIAACIDTILFIGLVVNLKHQAVKFATQTRINALGK